jgi:tetratricopeptide (TPR) repeat protein
MKKAMVVLLLFSLILSSCSLNKLAVRSAAPLFDEASMSIEKEKNWNFLKDSVPSNLMIMEGLLSIDPDNKKMLKNLIKGYGAYAFGVSETLYLEEQWSESNNTKELDSAIDYYGRALKHGLHYLKLYGIKTDEILAAQDYSQMKKLVTKVLKDHDGREVLFFTAQSWGGLMNLQRGNISLLSTMGAMKNMIDTVCEVEPTFQFGACDLFYGAYEVSRPRTLGGNPDKGMKIFKQAMLSRADNLLIPVAYLQYAVIPAGNSDEYKSVKEKLEKAAVQFKNLSLVVPGIGVENTFVQSDERLSVLNTIAMKRFEIIKKFEKKLF